LREVPVGPVPSAQESLPPSNTTVYYSARRGTTIVRADITYLRQDFSLMQKVPGVLFVLQKKQLLITIEPVFVCSFIAPATEGSSWKTWLTFVVKTRNVPSMENAGPVT